MHPISTITKLLLPALARDMDHVFVHGRYVSLFLHYQLQTN